MRQSRLLSNTPRVAMVAFLAAVVSLGLAQAAGAQPVLVDIDFNGSMRPNGSSTLTAVTQINNGSTIVSYQWTQLSGAKAVIGNASGPVANLRLGPRWRYRIELAKVLSEPPIGEEDLPPNVHLPEGEFPGGLQDRIQVTGLNHFALEEAGLVIVELAVTTTSGTYRATEEIHTNLPWSVQTGLRNVPVGVRVLVNAGTEKPYDWMLSSRPAGSSTVLAGAGNRIAELRPDVPGIYEVTVTDPGTGMPKTLEIYAGTWRGVIVAQDALGRPIADTACTSCHSSFAVDQFTPWKKTGHAEIFEQNLNTGTHYGPNCFECHSVGYNPDFGTDNGGFDEAEDYQDFLASGLLNNPGDNWTQVLEQFPEMAQLANIQCENCHGPNEFGENVDTEAHGWMEPAGSPRVSLSADVCGTCHGEPLRHARFQQWQLSAHANYELAIEEAESGSCARCHTANGFIAWLPVLLGEVPGDPLDNVEVTWTAEEAHPQTCATCHDPHAIGTVSGTVTNATVRIDVDTPDLIAGFRVINAGKGAICMTCHNSRRGLQNDATYAANRAAGGHTAAPHGSSQTDLLMGENAYLVNVGVRGRHSLLVETCVTCHMQATPPPDALSYDQGGTNHTFAASPEICGECHEGLSAENLTDTVADVMAHVKQSLQQAALELIEEQLDMGMSVDFDGIRTLTDSSQIMKVHDFYETRGRQAIAVTFTDGTTTGLIGVNAIDVIPPGDGEVVGLWDVADDGLPKAGWNYLLVYNDGSRGVHNPTFALQVLDAARDALGVLGGPRAAFELP